MTGRASRLAGPRLLVAAAVAAGLATFVGANAHLLYVAFASQPECVAHLKDSGAGAGYRAAKPAC